MGGSLDFSSLGSMSGVGVAVMVTLSLLSVWSLTISVERLIVLGRARRQSRAFVRVAGEHLAQGRTEAALAVAKRFPASPLARLAGTALALGPGQGPSGPRRLLTVERARESVERAMDRSSAMVADELGRGIPSLATIATTAPFIGLFGTVVGIIHAFASISEAGGGFKVVSQGISEALMATALGLVVAIPAAWMFNDLSNRVRRLSLDMANFSSELADALSGMVEEKGA